MLHRVELINELISYDELNTTEIAFKLNYSSVAHLSNQFKRITGLSPANYKRTNEKRRILIEDIGTPLLSDNRNARSHFVGSHLQQAAACA